MNKNTKYTLIGGTLLVIATGGIFAYKKIKNKADTRKAINAIKKGSDSTLGINIPEIAKQLGLELGTAYPWYDPRHATENDEKAKILVLKVPKPYIPKLIDEYGKVPETKGRNLQSDLQKLLDDWSEVSYLFK